MPVHPCPFIFIELSQTTSVHCAHLNTNLYLLFNVFFKSYIKKRGVKSKKYSNTGYCIYECSLFHYMALSDFPSLFFSFFFPIFAQRIPSIFLEVRSTSNESPWGLSWNVLILHSWKIHFFFFSTLKPVIPLLKKQLLILLWIPSMWWVVSVLLILRFFCLCPLAVWLLWVDFFEVFLLGICWIPWICGFRAFIKFGRFAAIFTFRFVFFYCLLLLPHPVVFEDSPDVHVDMFDGVTWGPLLIFLYSFFIDSSAWLVLISLFIQHSLDILY